MRSAVADGTLVTTIKQRVAPCLARTRSPKASTTRKKPAAAVAQAQTRVRRSAEQGGPLYNRGELRELASRVQVTPTVRDQHPAPVRGATPYGDLAAQGPAATTRGRFTGDAIGGEGIPARPYPPARGRASRAWRVAVEEVATDEWTKAFRACDVTLDLHRSDDAPGRGSTR